MTGISITFADGERLVVPASPELSVLAAVELSGHALAHNCRKGTCRTCVATTPDGEEVLLCQTKAEPDLAMRVSYRRAEMTAPTLRRAKINGFERVSPSVWQLRYRLQFPLPFLPGQYAALSLPGIDEPRFFSMANAVDDKEQVLYIRDFPEGAVGRYLAERAKPEDPFSLRGPFGVFYLRATPGPKLFIAGGTGLAPILSMLRALERMQATGPFTLIYAVSDAADAFALDTLRELAGRVPLQLLLVARKAGPDWSGHTGSWIDALGAVPPERLTAETEAYVCGPPGMVAAAREALSARGHEPARLFHEEFVHRPARSRGYVLT